MITNYCSRIAKHHALHIFVTTIDMNMAAVIIPVAGPVVRTVINKLFDIYAGKKKGQKEQKQAVENFLLGVKASIEKMQAENTNKVIEMGERTNLSGDQKFDKLAAYFLGTNAIDSTGQGAPSPTDDGPHHQGRGHREHEGSAANNGTKVFNMAKIQLFEF